MNTSAIILGMTHTSKHDQAKHLDKSTTSLLGRCEVSFLDNQINGAVFMIQRSCGIIPVNRERTSVITVICAAEELESVRTFGSLVVDIMGFGKTLTELLFLAYYALCAAQDVIPSQTEHRPALCVAPSGIVLHQWQKAIAQFPTLISIIAHGEKSSNPKFANNWVSATAMREAPASLKHWPPHLRYIFDKTNLATSSVVTLSSYETFSTRTVSVHIRRTKSKKEKKTYESKWTNRFDVIILDEGHKLRHPGTKTYANIKALSADVHWFLIVTSIINNSLVASSYKYEKGMRTDELS